MNIESVKQVQQEAIKFLERVEVYLQNIDDQKNGPYVYDNPKLSGDLKRQSMELTRALSEMRKPG